MDKQEQIRKMTTIVKDTSAEALLEGYVNTVDDDIINLVNAGYGNLKEFGERLKKMADYEYDFIIAKVIRNLVDEALREYNDD